MLTLANILELPSVTLAEKYKLPSDSFGIYFVVQNQAVIYIGITATNFKERFRTHHRYYWFQKKDAESTVTIHYQILAEPLEVLLELERKYQKYFSVNTRKVCKSDPEKLLELSISKNRNGYKLFWKTSSTKSEESLEILTFSKLVDTFRKFISELLLCQLNEKEIE